MVTLSDEFFGCEVRYKTLQAVFGKAISIGYSASDLRLRWHPSEVEAIEIATNKTVFKLPIYPYRESDYE